jgi:xylulose-5-phosphate/fructose-6-phosphate phosphoketolase
MVLQASPSRLSLDTVHKTHGVCLDAIARYCRVTNYLAAAQLYLKENVLLEEPLQLEHLKEYQPGRWDICPGINLIYAHLNHLIVRYDVNMFLVTGPRHSAPANLANLYLEGSLQHYYPEMTLKRAGLEHFVKSFSWLGGFPNYLSPGPPDIICGNGEAEHALGTAFGAVMDHPYLIVACIVGDSEVETTWLSHQFLDPVESGSVLPFLYLNGNNSAQSTIYAVMSNKELGCLFTGYGYSPIIIEGKDLNACLYVELDRAYRQIRSIQRLARSGHPVSHPRWPMIILRPPSDWTEKQAVDEMRPGERSFHWQQIQAMDLKTNPEHLHFVEQWLRSYHVEELFHEEGQPLPDIVKQCPRGKRRMGTSAHAFFIPGKEFSHVASYSCSSRRHARRGTGSSSGSPHRQGIGGNADAGTHPAAAARIHLSARRSASRGKNQGD